MPETKISTAHISPSCSIDLNQGIGRREFFRCLATATAIATLSSEADARGPRHFPETERVDYIELNHCYNKETGQMRFRQVIFWARQGGAIPHVRAWTMFDKEHVILLTKTDHDPESPYPYLCVFKKDNEQFHVRASRYKVTHTFGDPEEEDRKVFPIEARYPFTGW